MSKLQDEKLDLQADLDEAKRALSDKLPEGKIMIDEEAWNTLKKKAEEYELDILGLNHKLDVE